MAVAVAMLIAACSPNDPPGGEGRLSIATGGAGGVYQVYGGGLADLLSDEMPDSPTTAETTSASVDNLLLVANGDSDIAFSLADTRDRRGRGQRELRGAAAAARAGDALSEHHPGRREGGLGHRDDRGHGGQERLDRLARLRYRGDRAAAAPGRGPRSRTSDIDKRQLGVGESVQALRDGSIDGFFWSGGVPTGAVTDLATTTTSGCSRSTTTSRTCGASSARRTARPRSRTDEYSGVEGTTTIGVPNLLMVNEDDERRPRVRDHVRSSTAARTGSRPSCRPRSRSTRRRARRS